MSRPLMCLIACSIFILTYFECESSTISMNSPNSYASRRLNSPNFLQNTNSINGYIDRDSTIIGLQPPLSSSLTQMNAPMSMFNNGFSSSGESSGESNSMGSTMTPAQTTTENPILSDMKPDKVKFNLPAVLIVFVVFIGVVVILFIRITFLHALLVAGNKTSIQINGRFSLWGNNNVRLSRPNLVGKPLTDPGAHFTRSFYNEDNIFDDAWIITLKILNAISQLSEKWAREDLESESAENTNRLKKLE